MSDKAYAILLHDDEAVLKLATWLERSTSDISSLQGICVVTSDHFFEIGSTVVLVSADRGDLSESVEVEFGLGKWNATYTVLIDFEKFFKNANVLIRNDSISDKDFLMQNVKIG